MSSLLEDLLEPCPPIVWMHQPLRVAIALVREGASLVWVGRKVIPSEGVSGLWARDWLGWLSVEDLLEDFSQGCDPSMALEQTRYVRRPLGCWPLRASVRVERAAADPLASQGDWDALPALLPVQNSEGEIRGAIGRDRLGQFLTDHPDLLAPTRALHQLADACQWAERVSHQDAYPPRQQRLLEAIAAVDWRYRFVLEHAPIGLTLADTQTRQYLRVNPWFCNLVGYSEAELLGLRWDDLIDSEDIENRVAILEQPLSHGLINRYTIECRFRTKHHQAHWVKLTVSLVRDETGEALYTIGLLEDIHHRKLTQQHLQHRIEFEQLLTDTATRFINLNSEAIGPAMQDTLAAIAPFIQCERACIFEYSRDRTHSICIHEWHRADLTPIPADLRQIQRQAYPWSLERMERSEPIPVTCIEDLPEDAEHERQMMAQLQARAYLVIPLVLQGIPLGWMAYYRVDPIPGWDGEDVDLLRTLGTILASAMNRQHSEAALHQSEAILRRTTQEAQEANRAKSEFLAMMSHEIRTPLNAILGMTSVLLERSFAERERELLRTIQGSGEALLDLLNDILDFSKIEAGQLDLEPQSFGVATMLQEIVDLFQAQAEVKGLTLTLAIAADVPPQLYGDMNRLRQVLNNLLGNAIKFTHQGGVSVSVSRVQSDPERAADGAAPGSDGLTAVQLQIQVCDTGIGIPEASLGRLFQPFSQGDASIHRRFGGTGLGLVICDRLVRLLGGQIWVDSGGHLGGQPPRDWQSTTRPEQSGSCFALTVQMGVASGSLLAPESVTVDPLLPLELPPPSLSILLVEDVAINQQVALRLLEQSGYGADVVGNGLEALDALQRRSYAVVLMDVQMPEMDGWEATQAIRQMQRSLQPWIIGMTAYAGRSDRDRCFAVGMDDYLSKPIKRQDILQALARYQQSRLAVPAIALAAPALEPDPAVPKTEPDPLGHYSPEGNGGPERDQIDHESLSAMTDWMSLEDIQEVLGAYLEDSQQRMGVMHQAWSDRDWPELARQAHSLRPASELLGAQSLAEVLLTLEQAIAQGDDSCPDFLELALKPHWERVQTLYPPVYQTLHAYLAQLSPTQW